MKDAMVDRFYDRYKAQMRQESSLEKLIDGSRYFALEMRRNPSGEPLYFLRRSAPTDGGDSEFVIKSSQLSEAVKGPKPFIPALLRTLGMEKLAVDAFQTTHAGRPWMVLSQRSGSSLRDSR